VGQREDCKGGKGDYLQRKTPAEWKPASTVVIRKHGKDDYLKWNTYRSIALLRCKSQGVPKVTTELMSEEVERQGLLSNGQFESRKGR